MADLQTYVPIATQTVAVTAATISFSSIPGTYTDLILELSPVATLAGMNFKTQVGNTTLDTGSTYSFTQLRGNGSTIGSGRTTNGTFFDWVNQGVDTSIPHLYTFNFQNYANATTQKTVLTRFSETDSSSGWVAFAVGLWRSTAAINLITLTAITGTFSAGSTATLYGIKAA